METQHEKLSYDELFQQNLSFQEQLRERDETIHSLFEQLRLLKQKVFGRSSEQLRYLDERQELLFESEQIVSTATSQDEELEIPSHKRKKRGRKPLPANLPRERIEYEPEEINCACCGEEMQRIGEEITEELDFVPAKLFVKEHVKIKRACSKCKNGVSTGRLPVDAQIIEGARVGAGLLAHILVSKYCDHLPLYRQEQMFARHGVELARQRMCDWIGKITESVLMPIAQAQKRAILSSEYIRADETRLNVKQEAGEYKTGYLWGMQSVERDVYFEYDPSRAGVVAEELFKGCQAFIQTDLYAGYNKVFLPEQTIRVGCWAHVRRKYVEAEQSASKDCAVVLKAIAKLYRLEKQARRDKLDYKARYELRAKQSAPIVKQLKAFLTDLNQRVLPKSKLGKAVNYTLAQWDALELPFTNGMLELDNNAIEGQIRPIAVGRHNWLFAGSTRGATWAATLFSLIASCKLNDVNPFEYFKDIIRRAQTHPASRIVELTPRMWKRHFIENKS